MTPSAERNPRSMAYASVVAETRSSPMAGSVHASVTSEGVQAGMEPCSYGGEVSSMSRPFALPLADTAGPVKVFRENPIHSP